MRRYLITLVLLVGIVFVVSSMADLQNIVETLKRGDVRFLLLAVALQLLWVVNVAALLRAVYRTLGIEETLVNLLPVSTAAIFANVVVPTAGMSGAALFIAEARRRNYPPGRAAAAGALCVLFDYAAFICVLVLGLTVLIRRDNLTILEVMASLIFVLIAGVLAIMLFVGVRSPLRLGNLLAALARFVNRWLYPFLRRDFLLEERAHQFAAEIAEGLHEFRSGPANLVWPFMLALSKMALMILVLWATFMAFAVPHSVGTIVGGFSLFYLFFIVSPTPSGVGFLEGGMPFALQSLRVSLANATVITLAYRGVTFWLPLLLGMVAFRWVGAGKSSEGGPSLPSG